MIRMQDYLRNFVWIGLLSTIVMAVGCGSGKISTTPVKGKVLLDDRPIQWAWVIFQPTDGNEDFMRERPFAYTNEDGVFELRTFRPGDGAPKGNYKVSILWPNSGKSRGPFDLENYDNAPMGPDGLGGKYARSDASGLTAVVDASGEEIVFNLKSGK